MPKSQKIPKYLVLKGSKNFRGAFGAAKTLYTPIFSVFIAFLGYNWSKNAFLSEKTQNFSKTAPSAPFSGASRPKILQPKPPLEAENLQSKPLPEPSDGKWTPPRKVVKNTVPPIPQNNMFLLHNNLGLWDKMLAPKEPY